jgi:hypothetical protein
MYVCMYVCLYVCMDACTSMYVGVAVRRVSRDMHVDFFMVSLIHTLKIRYQVLTCCSLHIPIQLTLFRAR